MWVKVSAFAAHAGFAIAAVLSYLVTGALWTVALVLSVGIAVALRSRMVWSATGLSHRDRNPRSYRLGVGLLLLLAGMAWVGAFVQIYRAV